mgnify:FL=1
MTHQEFIGKLFEIEVVAHIAHLQVTGSGAYADHTALNGLYDSIVGLRDRYAESIQGKEGILTGYPQTISTKEGTDMIRYTKMMAEAVNDHRSKLQEGFLQQICDDIMELLYSTHYKLKNLK